MSTIRVSGDTSGYYDLTVPSAAGTNSIDLSKLPVKNADDSLTINRSGNGVLQAFQTDGTAVGQIDSSFGNLLIRTNGDKSGIRFDTNSLTPFKNGSQTDNAVDLGFSGARFKDIYLSGGINFSANANASGMTSELLNDYEEGTFTPSITFGGGSSGITYSSSRRIGQYTKIGNCVQYYVHIEMTNKGSSSGALQITGLPFTVVGNQHYIPGAVFIQSMNSLTDGAPIFRAQTSTTVLDCYQISNSSYAGITNSNCNNNTGIQVNGKYYTNV